MFLEKIKSAESGVLLYGITPPKVDTPAERIAEIAKKTIERLATLDIDALVVYDVQDESARTKEERPFPFLTALDPLVFASGYLGALSIPKIIYRPAGKFSNEELSDWLDELHQQNFYPVFVGVPAPDFPVKTSLSEAYKIWSKHEDTSVIGAVTIPERHNLLNDEDVRILDKMDCGVSYFISQCIFNLDYAKQVIEDLVQRCSRHNRTPPTVIFTITACGSAKTLQFMEWLGIHVPEELKEELKKSDDILEKSVRICLDIASALTTFCMERSIPFGFNIESVAIRKAEIEASIDIANGIGQMLKAKGVRKSPKELDVTNSLQTNSLN
ncbi:methylenetetrahydrofolate reductase [Spirosoma gilvum]